VTSGRSGRRRFGDSPAGVDPRARDRPATPRWTPGRPRDPSRVQCVPHGRDPGPVRHEPGVLPQHALDRACRAGRGILVGFVQFGTIVDCPGSLRVAVVLLDHRCDRATDRAVKSLLPGHDQVGIVPAGHGPDRLVSSARPSRRATGPVPGRASPGSPGRGVSRNATERRASTPAGRWARLSCPG
jgi:hypothetical protein